MEKRLLPFAIARGRMCLWLGFALAGVQTIFAGPEFDAAVALFDRKQFKEAQAAFQQIVAAEPKNAAACHYLGRAIAHGGEPKAADEAAVWLAKAVELEPKNAGYAETYGLTLFSIAARTHSPFAATKGRDALEKAVALDPRRLPAREMLFTFYQQAPWPLGSSAKATAHLEALRQVDPVRASEIDLLLRRTDARSYLSEAAIARTPTAEAQRQLRILRATFEPIPPVALSAGAAERVFLSDAIWISAQVGWGQPARNHYWYDEKVRDAVFLKLGDRIYEKGLYAHAPSRYVFPVAEKWKKFTATVGLHDGAHPEGSSVFTVRGDGRELYRSPILRAGESRPVELDISTVKELELCAEGGEGHNHHAWAIWVDPLVQR